MPITFVPISTGQLCTGYDWTIEDNDELAKLVARVALGQHRHVQRILLETDCSAYSPTPTALEGAKKLLTAVNEETPWHRDGWLFQVISWIAANLQRNGSMIAPPHMIHAHKGFDGLHVQVDQSTGRVLSVVVCEEKATGNPRKMIREEIWTEFTALERGERDNELVSEVSTLLDSLPGHNSDQAVHEIFWKEARAFRVSITVSDAQSDEAGRRRLFKGYESVVSGNVSRRRAETLHIDDLRKWMQMIAEKAIDAAELMEADHV